jgi:hypothetical protein
VWDSGYIPSDSFLFVSIFTSILLPKKNTLFRNSAAQFSRCGGTVLSLRWQSSPVAVAQFSHCSGTVLPLQWHSSATSVAQFSRCGDNGVFVPQSRALKKQEPLARRSQKTKENKKKQKSLATKSKNKNLQTKSKQILLLV